MKEYKKDFYRGNLKVYESVDDPRYWRIGFRGCMLDAKFEKQDLNDLQVMLCEVLETPTVKEDCNECVTTNHGEGCKSDCVCKCHKEEVKEDTKKECTGLPNDPYYCHGVWCGCVEPSVKNLQAKEFALDCARIHPEGKG